MSLKWANILYWRIGIVDLYFNPEVTVATHYFPAKKVILLLGNAVEYPIHDILNVHSPDQVEIDEGELCRHTCQDNGGCSVAVSHLSSFYLHYIVSAKDRTLGISLSF